MSNYAQPGTFGRQMLGQMFQRRQAEKQQQWQMDMYMKQREDQKTDLAEQRLFNETKEVFGLMFQAIAAEDSPAGVEQLVKRFQPQIMDLQEKHPEIARAMMAIYPEGYLDLKKKAFMSSNGPMPQQKGTFDENPMEYMQTWVNQQKYMYKMDMALTGDAKPIDGYQQFNKDYAILVDQQGNFSTHSPEVLNADPKLKEIAAAHNTTVGQLLHDGGNLPWDQQTLHIGDNTEIVRTSGNALTGAFNMERHVVGPRLGAGAGEGGGDPPAKKSPRPAESVVKGLAALGMGKEPKSDPEAMMIYQQVKGLGKIWKKNTPMFEQKLNEILQAQDPNFTYLVKTAGPGAALYRQYMGFGGLALGDNAYIHFVPGQRQLINSFDGYPIEFIIDEVNGLIHTGAGERLDPSRTIKSILEEVQSKTLAELGITVEEQRQHAEEQGEEEKKVEKEEDPFEPGYSERGKKIQQFMKFGYGREQKGPQDLSIPAPYSHK